MNEKKAQPKEFKPLEAAVNDAMETGFFGDKYFKVEKLIAICKQRGLTGLWNQQDLSKPLNLFSDASKDEESEKIDDALTRFADAIGFDANLVKRHFYAIRQGWEKQLLESERAAEIAFEEETTPEESEETDATEESTAKPAEPVKQPKEKATKEPVAATTKNKAQPVN
jgi:hypothetical protein